MNQVVSVELENNPQYGVVVSSRKVAEGLGKKHYHVMRDLDQILENSNLSFLENPDLDFLKNSDIKANIIPATYTVANQKRKYREYLLTKDGFTLYMFNIQGYNDFKWAYIQKFNEMEAALANVSKPVQQQLPTQPVQPQRPRMPYRKTWKGYPVMTTEDLMMLLHCDQQDVYRLKNSLGHCGKRLDKQDYVTFKRLHGIQSHASQMMIFERSDVVRMLEKRQVYNQYKDFIEQYFEPIHNECLSDEEMKKALKQAEYLCVAASVNDDEQIQSMIKKTLTTLLIKIGVWTENHIGFDGITDSFDDGTVEGKNKAKSLALADMHWNSY